MLDCIVDDVLAFTIVGVLAWAWKSGPYGNGQAS